MHALGFRRRLSRLRRARSRSAAGYSRIPCPRAGSACKAFPATGRKRRRRLDAFAQTLDKADETCRREHCAGQRQIVRPPLTTTNSSTYVVPVGLGTPGVGYPLQVDTGSADLLLVSTACGDCPRATDDSPYYDLRGPSSSFVAVNDNATAWRAEFSDGSTAAGFVARERVGLADVVLDSQVFGVINATNLTLAQQQISGILGLGFPRLSVLARALLKGNNGPGTASLYLPPLLESLTSSGMIPAPMFALGLMPPLSGGDDSQPADSKTPRYSLHTGSITLGGVSAAYVQAGSGNGTVTDFDWVDVLPFAPLKDSPAASGANDSIPSSVGDLENEAYLYWAVSLSSVVLNGATIPLNSTYASLGVPSAAVIDVGSNGMYGPQQDVERIFAQINYARQVSPGQWAAPCDTQATMGFTFSGRSYEIPPQDWLFAQVGGDSTMCLAWPVAVPSTGDGVDWTLGTPFLKHAYAAFSYGVNGVLAPQVGFLPIRNGSSGSDQASPTLTVDTVLPNYLLGGPDFSTPSYVFQSAYSRPSSTTVIQRMGLANSTVYNVTQPGFPNVVVVTPPPRNTNAATSDVALDVPGWPSGAAEHVKSGAGTTRAHVAVVLAAFALFVAP